MKRVILLAVTVLLSSGMLTAQADEEKTYKIPLIGEKAPSFTAETTNGTLLFPGDFGRKWKILFSHPLDFTPVCSSEILELAAHQKEFDELNVKLAVISTSPLDSHKAWKKALEEIEWKGQDRMKIKFPLIDDDSRLISREYGMIHPAIHGTRSVRGVFIIDPDNVIQAIYFYPMNVGRSSEELIRSVKALQAAKGALMTPSDWQAGDDMIISVPPVVDQSDENVPDGYYKKAWFLWYEKAKSGV
ncbi:MAG: redoxin domain-containing protein [Bacteroidales bacterium]|nr:redoxin domain-containing protein [Bacteroidales bacterium]